MGLLEMKIFPYSFHRELFLHDKTLFNSFYDAAHISMCACNASNAIKQAMKILWKWKLFTCRLFPLFMLFLDSAATRVSALWNKNLISMSDRYFKCFNRLVDISDWCENILESEILLRYLNQLLNTLSWINGLSST